MSRLNKTTIEGFVNSTLRKQFDAATETPECHREWWEYCTSPSKFVALAAPRGFAKSTAVTHCYSLASVLFRERSYVILVSDTTGQSIQFLGDIKRELTDNDDVRELFGVRNLLKDTEDDIIVELDDGHQFRIQAKGAEQKLRGLKWANRRPDLIVCDDLENDEIVLNKERRTKLKRWFYGALIPSLSDNGIIRIVGTILHLDSLLESLMPEHQLGSKRKEFLIQEPLKEYTTARTTWKGAKYRAHNQDFTKLLWSAKRTKEQLMDIKEDFVRQGLADVYSQEYLNIPLDEARAFFKKHDFLAMTDRDKNKTLNFYISADLAISAKTRADYTVFVVGGMDDGGVLHIKNVVRDRLDAKEIVAHILSLNKIYSPTMFSIEDGSIYKAIAPYLNDAMLRGNNIVPIQLVKPITDKISRAQTIQARMRVGGVRFDKSAEWYATFEDELIRFPRDVHDDQVDAIAYLGLIIDRMADASTPEEEEDEEYEEMVRENQNDRHGCSIICGY